MTTGRVHWTGVLAQTGVIAGGKLHGWCYAFLQFVVIDGVLFLDARCTPPFSPFPLEVRMDVLQHFKRLKVIRGQRATRLNANALIDAAYENAKS
ncbi:hypothetical protein RD110_15810 [Rhodoferax koreense]|uniref:Uncharacterized protein n=1 Tax=Rhodoferax koreensis TaxID=1842727 RepID=A0A1P8JXK2_9BURK|nr:hypothetical protein [Rhodoferax koreense]APW38487.1 hypothetical protein RD110_15810 [Rhodoferax koreense]